MIHDQQKTSRTNFHYKRDSYNKSRSVMLTECVGNFSPTHTSGYDKCTDQLISYCNISVALKCTINTFIQQKNITIMVRMPIKDKKRMYIFLM